MVVVVAVDHGDGCTAERRGSPAQVVDQEGVAFVCRPADSHVARDQKNIIFAKFFGVDVVLQEPFVFEASQDAFAESSGQHGSAMGVSRDVQAAWACFALHGFSFAFAVGLLQVGLGVAD